MALFRYPGRKTWWYEFHFAGQKIRESTRSRSKTLAGRAQQKRKQELEEGYHGLKKRAVPRLLTVAAEDWLALKKPTLAPKSYVIERTNLRHLLPVFGRVLISDIEPEDVSKYQEQRLAEGAKPKTVNLEVGTLRAILRRNGLWARIQPHISLLPVSEDVGRALPPDEEVRLLEACSASRSRSLYPAVVLGLHTCMRYSELQLLLWKQIDSQARTARVGKSKTQTGTGRVIPLSDRAFSVLSFWASQFPNRQPEHFVFPSERYGAAGDDFIPCAYKTDPTRPIGRWKEAWEAAKKRAGVKCRFHDLRHTGCTRMLENGVPFAHVAMIMGWSPATTARMVKRYGHIGQTFLRHAVEAISEGTFEKDSFANPFDVARERKAAIAN